MKRKQEKVKAARKELSEFLIFHESEKNLQNFGDGPSRQDHIMPNVARTESPTFQDSTNANLAGFAPIHDYNVPPGTEAFASYNNTSPSSSQAMEDSPILYFLNDNFDA